LLETSKLAPIPLFDEQSYDINCYQISDHRSLHVLVWIPGNYTGFGGLYWHHRVFRV